MAFHLVLVCKYRNQVFDDDMLDRCREIMRSTLLRWRCELLEFGGESDHVHLVFRAHPALNPSLETVRKYVSSQNHQNLLT